ncbi:MAG: hypothetical protein ABI597_12960 [Gammaproteobacteria bacterium]
MESETLVANAMLNNPVNVNTKRKVITAIGKGVAGIFSFSCGVTNANALIVSGLLTGGASYICAVILFIAVVLVNYKIFEKAVPKVLIGMFDKNPNPQSPSTSDDNFPLSPLRKAALFFGFILAISAGATLGALSYSSMFSFLVTISFFSAISIAFPPLSIILGIATFACVGSLMYDAIDGMVSTPNLIKSCIDFLYDLVNIDPALPRNENKSTFRIVAERAATLLITAIALPLAVIGLFMTMNACAPGLGKILMSIPNAIPNVVDIVCKSICYGFALLAQTPFVIRTAFLTAASFFKNPSSQNTAIKEDAIDKPNPIGKCIKNIIFQIARVLSSIGNGLVAMMGANDLSSSILAGGGGAFNTFSAAVADDKTNENNSTTSIINQLSNSQALHVDLLKDNSNLIDNLEVEDTSLNCDEVIEPISVNNIADNHLDGDENNLLLRVGF